MRKPYESIVINAPPRDWVLSLRRHHWVFLLKENEPAEVELSPEFYAGDVTRLAIRRFTREENRFRDVQIWYVRCDGTGLDGSRLMLPYSDNVYVPSNLPMTAAIVNQMQATLLARDLVPSTRDEAIYMLIAAKLSEES